MDIYVDSLMPNDSGNGLTPATAKKYWKSAVALLGRSIGQRLFVKAGQYYDVPVAGDDFPIIRVSNVTIDKYGTGANPVLDGFNWIAPSSGGWTLEGAADGGGYVWSIQKGTSNSVRRVYEKSTNSGALLAQRKVGDALRCAPNLNYLTITATTDTLASIKAHLNQTDCWYGSGSALTYKLYMWTPSNVQDPSAYYAGLAFVQSGTGTFGVTNVMQITQTQNLTVNNIDMRASVGQGIVVTAPDTDTIPTFGIRFNNCYVSAVLNGVRVQQNTTMAYATTVWDVVFKNCTVDSLTSEKEQEPNSAYNRLAASDLWMFINKIDSVRAEDCFSINGTHCGITLGAFDSDKAFPKNTGYIRHTVKAANWITYARGMSVDSCEPSCFVTNCVFDNMNVVSQITGSCRVIGNKWTNMRKWIRKPSVANQTTDGWIAFACYKIDRGNTNVGDDRYVTLTPQDVVFANNSCDGCYGTPIEIDAFDTPMGVAAQPNIAAGSIKMWNNVFIDSVAERAGKPFMTTIEGGTLTIGNQSFINNAFHSKITGGASPTATYRGTTYTDIDTVPGFTGTIIVDPKVDSQLVPMADSPLIGKAKFAAYAKDFTGRKFKIPGCIGAHEYFK